MIVLHIETPFASFRQAFARSFAESYPLPPPATVYGMLLSLVGEHFRRRHDKVKLAFAYKCRNEEGENCQGKCFPQIATTVRKLSRYKYGVASKQSKLGNAPDYVETLCGIEFLCWIDSADEKPEGLENSTAEALEARILTALQNPSLITRSGVLSLGLSDDLINDVSLCREIIGQWHKLLPNENGMIELPVWADHVKSATTRWQRYDFEPNSNPISTTPGGNEWRWTQIALPQTLR